MASPDFNIIGETLKMLGEEISKISDIAAPRPSHHDEPMNNQGVGDVNDVNATTAAEIISDRDNNTVAMELEELRSRSDAQKCANNNNRAVRQMNATRISLRKDNPLYALPVENILLEVPRTPANATIPDFPTTMEELKFIRYDHLIEILRALGLSVHGDYHSRLYRLADFIGVADEIFELKVKGCTSPH